MKIKNFLLILLALCGIILPSCSKDDEATSNNTTSNLTQYKWVCSWSDDPLVADDYEWAIFDDYTITLYFVSDYECVISYFRKHYDTDDGTSYERESQTVKYTVEGKNVILEHSHYTGTEFTYEGNCLVEKEYSSTIFGTYEREEITYSDREWINENYRHIELSPDESTSKPFKGLKEINAEGWAYVLFRNPHIDSEGRLTYYETYAEEDVKYEYLDNKIICRIENLDDYWNNDYTQISYSLIDGLIVSYIEEYFENEQLKYSLTGSIKYDESKRIVQMLTDDGEDNERFSRVIYNFKWNSSGDIYESNKVLPGKSNDPFTISKYEYHASIAQIPSMVMGTSGIEWANDRKIDPILVMEGYYGNSMTKHCLKSIYEENVNTGEPNEYYAWSYTYDSKGRIANVTQERKFFLDERLNEISTFIFKWE